MTRGDRFDVRSDRLSRRRFTARAGLATLASPTLALFVLGVLGATIHGEAPAMGALLLTAAIGVGVGVRYEWWFLSGVDEVGFGGLGEGVPNAAAILVGAVVTIGGVVELEITPVLAASLVGISVAVAWPRRAVPAYCGAFVGMTSPTLFVTYWHAVLAAGVASVVYAVSQPVFQGVGGKLGTTAFVGATVTAAVTAGTFHSGPLPERSALFLAVGYAVAGAVVTYAVHTRSGASPVLASGIVGATGGAGLPLVHGTVGGLLAAAVFSASFAGMSSRDRIPDERWIALAGLVVGLVVVYTQPYLGGSGGKLGTIAFGSCLAIHGLLRTLHVVRIRRRADEFPDRDTT